MTDLEREMERQRLFDQLKYIGMTNINMPTYEDGVRRRAELTLQTREIYRRLAELDARP